MRVQPNPTSPVAQPNERNEQFSLGSLRATVANYVLPVFIGLAALPTAQADTGYQAEEISPGESAVIIGFALFCVLLALGGIGEEK